MTRRIPASPLGLRPRPPVEAPRLSSLTQAVDAAQRLDDDSVPPRQLADEVICLFIVINRLHSMVLTRLGRVDAHGVSSREYGSSTGSWLRHHTGLPSGQAADLVRTARSLRSSLPDTEAALASGEVTVHHARTIARTARSIEDAVPPNEQVKTVADVEAVMLQVGRAVDAGSLTGFASRVRQIADPDGALVDAQRAHERRWLTTSTTIDGMVSVDGLLDREAGALLLTALGAATAPRGPDDQRSAGQRRADALVDICGHVLDTGNTSSSGGVRPHLLVTTPLGVLGDSIRDLPRSAEVAEVAWTGPLTNSAVKRLACDAEITRVVVDPPSLPLDVGRTTRSVPVHLRNALVVRDRGCVAEGCDRPPAWTEAHHIVHWAEGGSTSLDNLVLLCRTHHRKVHDARWQFHSIGGTWKLTPPPTQRMHYVMDGPASADPGTNPRTNHESDSRRGATKHELPSSGIDPGADGDTRDQHSHPEEGEQRHDQGGRQ